MPVAQVPDGAEALAVVTEGRRLELPAGSHVDDDGEVTRPDQPSLHIDPQRDRVVIPLANGVRRDREPDVGMTVAGLVILAGGTSASVVGMATCHGKTPPPSSPGGLPSIDFDSGFRELGCVIGGVAGIAASVVVGGLLFGFGLHGSKVKPRVQPVASLGGEW